MSVTDILPEEWTILRADESGGMQTVCAIDPDGQQRACTKATAAEAATAILESYRAVHDPDPPSPQPEQPPKTPAPEAGVFRAPYDDAWIREGQDAQDARIEALESLLGAHRDDKTGKLALRVFVELTEAVAALGARVAALEEAGDMDSYVRNNMHEGESFEDAKRRILTRFDELYDKARDTPLIGEELSFYREVSARIYR